MLLLVRRDFIEEVYNQCPPEWLIATLAKFEMAASHQAFWALCQNISKNAGFPDVSGKHLATQC